MVEAPIRVRFREDQDAYQVDRRRTAGHSPALEYNIKTLQARHRLIVQMHLAGNTNREIAAALDVNLMTVGQFLNAPMTKQYIAQLLAEQDGNAAKARMELIRSAEPIVKMLSEAALEGKMKVIMVDENGEHEVVQPLAPSLRLSAATDILDRVSETAKVQHVKTQVDTGHVPFAAVTEAVARYTDYIRQREGLLPPAEIDAEATVVGAPEEPGLVPGNQQVEPTQGESDEPSETEERV